MDLIIKEKMFMQILNLILQEQHQNVLKGLLFKDDDYDDWIICVAIKEDA
jgi:hypothetical protein